MIIYTNENHGSNQNHDFILSRVRLLLELCLLLSPYVNYREEEMAMAEEGALSV